MSVEKTVKYVVANKMGVQLNEVTRDTRLEEDLDADSLDHFELSLALEDELDVGSIPDETIEGFETVGDIIKHLEKKVNGSEVERL